MRNGPTKAAEQLKVSETLADGTLPAADVIFWEDSMKRVADGPGADGFAIQVPPRPRTTGGLHIPADRSSTDGRRLDSLMDPVPGFPGADLATLLGTHPLASVRTETVQAILMLDDGNHVPHILVDSDTCRRAAQWLLALEQFRLLYRLLRDRPMDYAMPVSTTQQAHALERMATLGRWPDGASVELHLSTALPPEAMRAMCPFLAWPPLLSLQVAAEGTQDAQAAGLFAQALQGREWAALSIACGPLALDVLQALPGVRARSIAFTVDRPDDAHKLAFEAALFEIVSRCGAHMLNVADPSVDDALAARLVEAQASWGSVHLSIADPMLALLREERLKIGQVELYLSDAMRNTPLTLSPILLYLLERNGVNTFIAHGMVNLTDFAQSLDTYASHTMGFFDRIEGCFVAQEDDDIDQALTSLSRNPAILTLRHRAMAIEPGGYTPIGADAQARLNGMSASNRATPNPDPDPDRAALRSHRVWTSAVQCISDVLAPSQTMDNLSALLACSINPWIPLANVTDMPWLQQRREPLLMKLTALAHAKLDHRVAREAIALRLRADPDMVSSMCERLIVLGCWGRDRPQTEWQALAAASGQWWMSECMLDDSLSKDAVQLARALDRNRWVESVECQPAMVNVQQAREALTLLRQNPSILHVNVMPAPMNNGLLPLDAHLLNGLFALTTRHRLRHPDLSAVGFGRGFGWSLGDGQQLGLRAGLGYTPNARPFVDPGALIGRFLDPASAQALAMTSKATYVGWHNAWEIEIDRLAALFDLTDHGEFMARLVSQLTHLSETYTSLAGQNPGGPYSGRAILDKVYDMGVAGVPTVAIGQAIGRRLLSDPGSSRDYLEALAYIGVMPPGWWLKEGLGIDVPT